MENSRKVVRNIPIWIEGRTEPLINKDHDPKDFNDLKATNSHSSSHSMSNAAAHSSSSDNVAQKTQSSEHIKEPVQQEISAEHIPEQKHLESSIEKIQAIQNSVLDLMKKIEDFNGENPKEYLFLDEMLTQNLIKLDNIETNMDVEGKGKENVKSARREAIKCINTLIILLEEKHEEFKKSKKTNEQQM